MSIEPTTTESLMEYWRDRCLRCESELVEAITVKDRIYKSRDEEAAHYQTVIHELEEKIKRIAPKATWIA